MKLHATPVILLAVCFGVSSLRGQSLGEIAKKAEEVRAKAAQHAVMALTDADITRLVAMGVSEQTVIAVVQQAKATEFDLSTQTVSELTAAGVSPDIIAAMRKSTAVRPSTMVAAGANRTSAGRASAADSAVRSDKAAPKTLTNADLDSRPVAAPAPSAGGQPSLATDVPLVLDAWDYSFKPGERGNDYYTVTVRIRNVSAKAIKLIDGGVNFTDLLGAPLYGVKLSPDVYIAAGATYVDGGDYPINQFINRELRMRDLKVADVKATISVRRVVFTDNTIFSR
jgi:hypothetical protein